MALSEDNRFNTLYFFKFILLFIVFMAQSIKATEIKSGSFKLSDNVPVSAQKVIIGFYPRSVYGLDIEDNTFHLHTYIWMRWKGEIDPTESMEIINGVDEAELVKTNILKTPSIQPDGSKYQIMDIESRFSQTFFLDNFPLDKQQLSVLIEDSSHGIKQIAYIIDEKNSGYGARLDLPGWDLNGWKAETLAHDYGSSFGDETGIGGGSIYSTARFDINISRPISYFYWKLLLPLVIVLCGAWIVLLLDPHQIEVRTGLPATALLTTVFLQQSYSDNLPQVGYLVLMDKLYVIAYILILLTLIRVIFTATSFDIKSTDERHVVKIKRGDRILLALEIILFTVLLLCHKMMMR